MWPYNRDPDRDKTRPSPVRVTGDAFITYNHGILIVAIDYCEKLQTGKVNIIL